MYFQLNDTNVRILGSLHTFPKAFPGYPRWTLDAAKWADEIILEVDHTQIGAAVAVPLERACQAQLSASTWAKLVDCWPTQVAPLDHMPPWRVALNISTLKREDNPDGGMEHAYLARAKAKNLPVSYLETAKEFGEALGSIPLPDVEAIMLDAIANIDRNNEKFVQLYHDWRTRKLEVIWRRQQTEFLWSLPSVRSALLVGRNKGWLPKIEAACAANRRTLIVVGALHLYGPDNVLDLLGRPSSEVR